jgi:hypothetical protein
VVVVLQAYFDESGTSGNEPLTVISGFIATDQAWLDFDALWRSAIKNDLRAKIEWFHMVECENGTGRYDEWSKFPEVRRSDARILAETILKAGPTGFWWSVDVADWNNLADKAIKDRYPKPYYLCFEECLRQVTGWAQEFAPGESVELIFAEQGEYKDRAATIYDAYMQAKRGTPIQSLRFAPMPNCTPLQAADMAVYCTNKEMVSAIYGKETRERIYRSVLDVLSENPASFTGGHRDGLSFVRGLS